jgi:riboflavin synthase
MFTGIIEETAKIRKISPLGNGRKLTISAQRILDDLKVEDSVCISGVCLTVVAVSVSGFTVEAVGATLDKTTLGRLMPGRPVNLERAMQLDARLGGHLVQGHVNGIGKIVSISERNKARFVELEIPAELEKYIIAEGSIAIDGISLTVANQTNKRIVVSIIPYTWEHTTLGQSKPGDLCNIETDMIAKYVEKLMPVYQQKDPRNKITLNWLKRTGY